MPTELDAFDNAIISELKLDARQSVANIAAKVNLARSSVSERIKKLERNGIIRGYRVQLQQSMLTGVSAYFEIVHADKSCRDITDAIAQIPEVLTCHGISGHVDLLVFAKMASMQRLHEVRAEIDALPSVRKITTHVVMNEWL
ncbi:Lrp/AsnC family transcriptional regulator [Ferrimonas aestuarii]|uniref:Lrp/AsnC family transcriptional regulator n=1 Tax=Ferrimonas aestuarii TaxID=2569539 RepID=A0A4U1BQE9_9GAMM|nr:Lrp/AsnC family transcriptional regulator [Ferrimonas aestuarii]TKB56636.1 Lrp/AsnC family transcriptional regulator [Ferrimonas aestuarii]